MSSPLSLIVHTVAAAYDVPEAAIMSARQQRYIIRPRHIAMYLGRELTTHSIPQIGRFFHRDHTTVMHALNRVTQQMSKDQDYHKRVLSLRDYLQPIVGKKDYLLDRIDNAVENLRQVLIKRALADPAATIKWLEDCCPGRFNQIAAVIFPPRGIHAISTTG